MLKLGVGESNTQETSSTLPSKTASMASRIDSQGADPNRPDSSWPFRSQSTDRSLIRRSMQLYLENAHQANQGKRFRMPK